jgi:hypothetical protein
LFLIIAKVLPLTMWFSGCDEASLRGMLMPLIANFKRKRLQRKLRTIVERRAETLHRLHAAYMRSHPGSAWLQLPRLVDFPLSTNLYASLLPFPVDANDELIAWNAWKTTIRPAIKQWAHNRRVLVCKSIPDPPPDDASMVPVFFCGPLNHSKELMVGMDEAIAHRHGTWYTFLGEYWLFNHREVTKDCLVYAPQITLMVKKLMGLVGVGNAVEMDQVDARFVCDECRTNGPLGALGKTAMTWRECVSFYAISFLVEC